MAIRADIGLGHAALYGLSRRFFMLSASIRQSRRRCERFIPRPGARARGRAGDFERADTIVSAYTMPTRAIHRATKHEHSPDARRQLICPAAPPLRPHNSGHAPTLPRDAFSLSGPISPDSLAPNVAKIIYRPFS